MKFSLLRTGAGLLIILLLINTTKHHPPLHPKNNHLLSIPDPKHRTPSSPTRPPQAPKPRTSHTPLGTHNPSTHQTVNRSNQRSDPRSRHKRRRKHNPRPSKQSEPTSRVPPRRSATDGHILPYTTPRVEPENERPQTTQRPMTRQLNGPR
ncbi:hypothetical protein MFRU_001g03720 [Monilinia fructicola]|nr:hypothetical protein MFRU_001g03720 [Monilinia fructicola]